MLTPSDGQQCLAQCSLTLHACNGCVAFLCILTGVLDIAGGRGDLAHVLSTVFGVDTTVIDPVQRPRRHASQRSGDGGGPARVRRPAATLACVTSTAALPGRVRQLVQPFDLSFGQPAQPHDGPGLVGQPRAPQEEETTEWLLNNASVLVGLHPDQPTGDIATVANSRRGPRGRAPFAVVPCCVFSELFPERTIGVALPRGGISESTRTTSAPTSTPDMTEAGRPVRETHDLTVWLAERSLLAYARANESWTFGPAQGQEGQGQVRVCRLPFNGRNQVVYTMPSGSLGSRSDCESATRPHAKRSKVAC
jgi:hypothetical protein